MLRAAESAETVDPAAALDAYRVAADGLRRCLRLADMAADHGSARRAADYLLGALAELRPELSALASIRLTSP